MKIKLKNTPDQIELIKAMGSKDKIVALEAQQAMADFIGEVVQKVSNLAASSAGIYVDWPYNEDDSPSFPLDQYYNANVNEVQVWQQNMAGGLGTSLVSGLQEMLISTYRLDTAVSFLKKTIRRGRLPVVSLGLNRMAQELLRKQERNRWLVILRALAEATTDGNRHHIAATTASQLVLHDFNRLMTRSKRVNVAFDGGTPDEAYSRGATDMWISPEMTEEIRSFVYQPMNTRAVPNTDESTAVPLPDNMRERIYQAGGLAEIYGIVLHEANELGVSRRYNNIFAQFVAAGSAPGGGNFATASDELLFAVDLTKDACIRPVATNADSGSTFVAQVDDQWTSRAEQIGFYGSVEEGAIVVDSRALSGLIV